MSCSVCGVAGTQKALPPTGGLVRVLGSGDFDKNGKNRILNKLTLMICCRCFVQSTLQFNTIFISGN